MATSVKERRKAVRTELLLKVEYDKPENLLSDYLTDVSTGGLFIHTEERFDEGQTINFMLSFPGLMGKEVHLDLQDALSPAKLTPTDDADTLVVVMPMRA